MINIDSFPDVNFIDDMAVEDVLRQMVSDYQTKYAELTGKAISLSQADPYRLIMQACTMQIYQVMQYVDFAGKMGLLKYSRDRYLDNLAAVRGIERLAALPAKTTIRFEMSAPAVNVPVSIPTGTKITNGDEVWFATDEYAEIAVGQTYVDVEATCTEAGLLGNDFEAGEFTVLANVLPYITSAYNTTKTEGGRDRESDDALRDRVLNFPNAYSVAGPKGAYEYHTKLADSRIADVVVTSPSAGEVKVLIVLEGGAMPDSQTINKVQSYIRSDDIRPLTDYVTVDAPVRTTFNLDLTYYISSSDSKYAESIDAAVRDAVDEYLDWQQTKIGRSINPSVLIQKVMQAGAKRVDVVSPTYTAVSADSVASVQNVSVSYGGIEDD